MAYEYTQHKRFDDRKPVGFGERVFMSVTTLTYAVQLPLMISGSCTFSEAQR